MQSSSLAFTSVIVVLIISCSNKHEFDIPIYEPGSMEYGWAVAKKNGKEFRASALARRFSDQPDSLYALYIGTESVEGFEREFISIGFMSFGIEEYVVSSVDYNQFYPNRLNVSYHTRQDDGDVSEDSYIIDDAYPGYLKVTSLDTASLDSTQWTVSGEFDLGFVISPFLEKVNPLNPDQVRLTHGQFEVRFLR
ncbi:MAG TPA: hypothetical protein VI603_18280 [Saprospiraceae bacterium]|nr:hypothetical protein [Saprospiraceae bacterium]